MKFKEFLKTFFTNIKDGVSRFIVAFICSILCFLTVSYHIIFEPPIPQQEILFSLYATYIITAVLSVLLKISEEYITDKLKGIYQYILCSVASVVSFILIKTNYDSLYTIMAYSGIMIALLCFIFFVLMRGENRNTAFPKLVASLIFTNAVCGVISGGLSTCIAAFQSLIFNWDDIYKVYSVINLFVWIVGFINIYLSFIPKKDVPISQSKIFRIFVLFAGLPLYILLIAILMVYLAKIVITWNMPVGEINWFASFASLFFIFFVLSVTQYKEKLATLFVKFGGYFLIPVLIMQAIAVFERINAYGLTTPRTVSLTLIVISILFIFGAIVTPKHFNKIALISGIIVLFVTVTPFNVIDMPIASQTKILETKLIENAMLKDGIITPNSNIDNKAKERIISAYNYLKYDAKKLPDFIPDDLKKTNEIFGFSSGSENNSIYCRYSTKTSVDISAFSKMLDVEENDDIIVFDNNGEQVTINLKEIAKELYTQYGDEQKELDIYMINESIGLYLRSFNFDLVDNEIQYCYFNGYVFIK